MCPGTALVPGLSVALDPLLWVALLEQGLHQRDPEVPSYLNQAVVIWLLYTELGVQWMNASKNFLKCCVGFSLDIRTPTGVCPELQLV